MLSYIHKIIHAMGMQNIGQPFVSKPAVSIICYYFHCLGPLITVISDKREHDYNIHIKCIISRKCISWTGTLIKNIFINNINNILCLYIYNYDE